VRRIATLLLAAVAFGSAGAEPVAIAIPMKLSETGLYLDMATGRVDSWNLPFEPQYPLWTDGADKSRWIRIPDGTTIDARDPEKWVFPVGTRFWKEFAFHGRKVETRMIWRATETEWIFVTYAWNAAQTDADLVPEEGIRNAAQIVQGRSHSIPSRADCLSCHQSAPAPILGFNPLQLSDDRDPLAPHARPLRPGDLTLKTLDQYRLLSPRQYALVDHPPRIHAETPVERAALGYLAGNCGHCHNKRGPIASLGMELAHGQRASLDGSERCLLTLKNVASAFVMPGQTHGRTRRLAPRNPDDSAIVYRMSSRKPSSQMPPLGTVMVDTEAVELMKRWIREW
jgi:hypothetical protein